MSSASDARGGDSIYHLHGLLYVLDDEIRQLVIQRETLLRKIAKQEELMVMRERATLFNGLIMSVASVKDPVASLLHRNNRLEPWRHNLPRKYFENTHEVWPSPTRHWTRAKASEFFEVLTAALERDVALLDDSSLWD